MKTDRRPDLAVDRTSAVSKRVVPVLPPKQRMTAVAPGHDNPSRHGPPLATLAIIGISTAVYLLVQHFESSSSGRLTPFLDKGSVGPVWGRRADAGLIIYVGIDQSWFIRLPLTRQSRRRVANGKETPHCRVLSARRFSYDMERLSDPPTGSQGPFTSVRPDGRLEDGRD